MIRNVHILYAHVAPGDGDRQDVLMRSQVHTHRDTAQSDCTCVKTSCYLIDPFFSTFALPVGSRPGEGFRGLECWKASLPA